MKSKAILILAISLVLMSCEDKKVKESVLTNDSIERKVDSVLSMMTLEEKIGQMNQFNSGADATGPVLGEKNEMEMLKDGKVGSLLNLRGAEKTREAQELVMKNTRMKIPMVFGLDVIHGYRTIFPIPLGEAASWDLEAMEKSARIAAVEATSRGIHWTFAPMVDISRDARWGRIMEGAGEDTYYGSLVAAARVKGFQGNDLSDETSLLACAKHFAAYGAAEAGRDYNTTDMSDRTLREIYLPPFKSAVDAGVGTFMNSFNEIAGVPATAHKGIQRDILKGEWGFDGFIVSDWGSIREMIVHGIAADNKAAASLAANAGSDMDMESEAYINFLGELVEEGKVPEEYIDDAVRRILRVKFLLGLFDDPYKNCDPDRAEEVLLSAEHRAHARDAGRKSIVLLKNEGQTLPLATSGLKIALIGPLADSHDDLIGNWSAMGRGEECVSLLEGVKGLQESGNKILYAKGCDIESNDKSGFAKALSAARNADVIIAAVGEAGMMSGEGQCRTDIGIPGVQVDLLKELKKTGKPMVAVLMNGRPLTIPWLAENSDAILETWFLGTESGNAIADVLFGKYNPSGKLPVSFPQVVGQVPIYYNHKNTGRPAGGAYTSRYLDVSNEPLYPFGYGLSYTQFEYGDIELDKTEIHAEETLTISVELKNVGEFDGEEVVQLYVRDLFGSVTRPVKELKGFQKVFLKKGESKSITFTLRAEDLKFWNIDMEFVAEPGDFQVFVGGNSRDVKEAGFALKE